MRLLLITLTCLAASLAAPEEKQKRDILPGDPRYGIENHHHHHDHPETIVETTKSIGGYAYSIPGTSGYAAQTVYGPSGFQAGIPVAKKYLSPFAEAKFASPIGIQEFYRFPQATKTIIGTTGFDARKTITHTAGPLPVERFRTVAALPPATSYGTPVIEHAKAFRTFKTAPIIQAKDIGSTVFGERLAPISSSFEEIHTPFFKSYSPAIYNNISPALRTIQPGYNGIGLKSVHVEAPLTSVQITKTHPTTYSFPHALELQRTSFIPQASVVEHVQPFAAVKTVETLPAQHLHPLPAVKTIQPLPAVHSVHTVKSFETVTPLPAVRTLEAVTPLPHPIHHLPAVRTLEAVTPLPHPIHHLPAVRTIETATPLPQAIYPLPAVRAIETATSLPHAFHPLPALRTIKTVTPLPHAIHSLPAVKTVEHVTPLPHAIHPLPAVRAIETVTPLPHAIHSPSIVKTIETLPAVEQVHHVETVPAHHPLESVEILPPEPVHRLTKVHTPLIQTRTHIQRGPITDFFNTITDKFPSLPSLPQLPGLPSFPFEASTAAPIETASEIHVDNGIGKESISIENPLFPADFGHIGIQHHGTPTHEYIQPTDANGGYIY